MKRFSRVILRSAAAPERSLVGNRLSSTNRFNQARSFEYCTLITGLRGVAPIVDAAPVPVTWPGEAAAISESDQVFSSATMKPHLVAGQIRVSKQLLLIGAPGLDAYLRKEIARSIFSQLSQKILTGTGTGQDPIGVAHVTGTTSLTLTPSWAQIVECETNAATANITEFGNFVYVVNPTELGTQKPTAKRVKSLCPVDDTSGLTNGFPTLTPTPLDSGHSSSLTFRLGTSRDLGLGS